MSTNWAAVKTATNNWVYIQATLSPNDPDAAKNIQWSGGEEVPWGDKSMRRVTKTTSAETTVAATLGATNMGVKIWIIWATITPKFSGGLTSGDPLSFAPPNTNTLGPVYGFVNAGAYTEAEFVGKITPSGVEKIIGGWKFNQTVTARTWGDSDTYTDHPIGMDGWDSSFERDTPDASDQIYFIDGPGYSAGGASRYKASQNFSTFITYGDTICSDYLKWYSHKGVGPDY